MFLYLLCCFYFGKLISAGPPETSGVLIRRERINMSGWVRQRAVHVPLISSEIGWISKVSNYYLRQWSSLKSLSLLPAMSWWDSQHIWHKGGTSSLQMATVKTWMVKQLVATTGHLSSLITLPDESWECLLIIKAYHQLSISSPPNTKRVHSEAPLEKRTPLLHVPLWDSAMSLPASHTTSSVQAGPIRSS